ncbi:hypothetical protein SAMN06297144_2549 [Sphingomonas guangdongensis]|uniref:Uncharacterized protein n=1 Tax=Sphingomonas guangdongensis TaxID=1141890 RepID=A0A285R4Z1_9SPHN|nr:hypothetical protein [Sphingomonas guangdongensis]SOB87417.1 hypothetical protein SAMN06297144_2549 [Sphingomonas guangdongensis]
MIDEDEVGVGEQPFARSYDSFKHMTGVALLSLGGVFAFTDGSGGMQFDRKQIVVILSCFLVAAVTSVLMAGSLAALEVKPEPRAVVARRIRIGSIVVGMALSGGLGGFTYNFIAGLLK